MLRGNASGGSVGTAENDWDGDGTGRHVQGLGRRIDNLVDSLHSKIEGHEFADGP